MQYKNLFFSGLLLALSLPLQVFGGRISYYLDAPSYNNPGSCGREYLYDYYVALNAGQLDGDKSYYCGKCVKIVYNNKYLVGRISDRCPGCPHGGLDISPQMFDYFVGRSQRENVGVIQANWSIVSCDEYGKKGECSSSGCGGSSSHKTTTTKKTTTTTTKKTTTTTTRKTTTTTTKIITTTTTTSHIPSPTSSSPAPSQATTTPATQTENVSTETQAVDQETPVKENPEKIAEAPVEIKPVFSNEKSVPKETEEDKKEGGNPANYIVPATGAVIGAAGIGLLYLKRENKYENISSQIKSITRSITTRGTSLGRSVTRSITTRGTSLGRSVTRSLKLGKKPTPPTLPTTNAASEVIDVINDPTEVNN